MTSDDFDIVIEAMLEAPYKKEEVAEPQPQPEPRPQTQVRPFWGQTRLFGRSRAPRCRFGAKNPRISRSRDRDRRRRSRSRDRRSRHRSRSRERRRSRSRERRRDERSRRRFGHSKSPLYRDKSPVREPLGSLSPEERDARTVFCMQLAARIRPRDLEDFFSAVGKVRDVRIISDRNSRRSKGIAYVEFCDIQSVPLAIGLTGQRLLGVPIIVQASQAEKNRLAAMANNLQKGSGGPMRLYVGALHCNITKEMLRGIFEPFGKIDSIVLVRDPDTGQSKGYGFITVKGLGEVRGVTYGVGVPLTFLCPPSGEKFPPISRFPPFFPRSPGSGLQLPSTAQALQLNGALPLGALNPAALTALSPALNLASQTLSLQLSGLFTPQTM
uniref:RNA binding motif protein 23 n=1 Tax=Cairina moschata TaxID=8855 RepID=A0A8C3BGB0_CAIMO